MRSTTPTRGRPGGRACAGSRSSCRAGPTVSEASRRFTFRSVLPYDLVFEIRSVRVEKNRLLEGVASGELVGTGRWRFFAEGP